MTKHQSYTQKVYMHKRLHICWINEGWGGPSRVGLALKESFELEKTIESVIRSGMLWFWDHCNY